MSLSSPVGSPLSPFAPGCDIVFESYLHKTPPLDRLFVNWRKRWFVLSRKDTSDPSTLELSYFKDVTKKGKRTVINLTKFIGIRPNAKVGHKENVFAIETEDRKYILRAPDQLTKNIWLAKLCELCGQEQVYHVTVPHQPSATYNEAILKLSSATHITVVAPSTSETILEIPFKNIRRMGCMETYSTTVIWFETCKKSLPDDFNFFTLPSGIEAAHAIVQEMKSNIECSTGILLIMEDAGELELSFISREHYGCQEFSTTARGRILQAGLRKLPSLWRPFMTEERSRRVSEPAMRVNEINCGVSLEDWASTKGRRMTSVTVHPLTLSRKHTLEHLRQLSTSSSERGSPSLEIPDGQGSDSGFNSDVFEPPTGSPARKRSHESSLSSHDSSGASLPYSPFIAENEILEDPFEGTVPYMSPRRPSAPHVPPRSVISLQQQQQAAYLYSSRKSSTSSTH